jgi:hypothetical protein
VFLFTISLAIKPNILFVNKKLRKDGLFFPAHCWGTGNLSLREQYAFVVYSECEFFTNSTKPFDSLAEVKQFTSFPQFSAALRTGGQGIEPQLMASKATVLPLDDPPIK